MKKNYTTPEIQVTKYVVENEITSSTIDANQNLLFTATGEDGKTQVGAVQVVNYTDVFNVQ